MWLDACAPEYLGVDYTPPITDKGFARLEAIWSAWTQHVLLPTFFTAVETLSLGTIWR